jgi:hypothetical protein
MQLQKKKIVFICAILFLSYSLIAIHSTQAQAINEKEAANPKITIWCSIYDIYPETKTAEIGAFVVIDDLPYNGTILHIMLTCDDQPLAIECTPDGQQNNNLWKYHGNKNLTCVLEGSGDVFPFDKYTLNLEVKIVEGIDVIKVRINDNSTNNLGTNVYFTGSHQYDLKNNWQSSINSEPHFTINERKIVIDFVRSDNSFRYNFLIFLLPIIAIYYFFGASLIVDPKTHLNERLTMYVSILFFVPVFLISIQSLIPYRTSISFPEILLINLIISCAIMTGCSFVGKYKVTMNRYPWIKPAARWDLIGVAFSMVSLFFLYIYAVPQIPVQPSFIFLYLIIPAYIFWSLAKIRPPTRQEGIKIFVSFIIGFLISLMFYVTSLFTNSIILQLIMTCSGSLLAGLTFGYIVGNLKISVFLGFVSGILWSILLGVYIGSLVNGYTGAINGMISLGVIGGVYAPFSAFGGLIGYKLTTLIHKKQGD